MPLSDCAEAAAAAPLVAKENENEPSLPICLITGGTGLLGNALKWRLLMHQRHSHQKHTSSKERQHSGGCYSGTTSESCSISKESPEISSDGRSDISNSSRDEKLSGAYSEGVRAGETIDAEGYRFVFVGSKQADLRCPVETTRLFAQHKPSALVHLAARVGGLFSNMDNNLSFLEDNLHINDNVLQAAHRFQVRVGIFCLSTCIFPAKEDASDQSKALCEEDLHEGPPHWSNEGYAYAKRLLEISVRLYVQKFHYHWNCIAPTNMYGPFDNFSLSTAHVLPALIHKAFLAHKKKEALIVGGSGLPLRQFIFAGDCAEILLKLLFSLRSSSAAVSVHSKNADNYQLYIIAADSIGAEISTGSLAQLISHQFSPPIPVKFDKTKADGVYKKTVSTAKLRAFLGEDFTFTPLSEGIRATVQWFIQNCEGGNVRR